MKLVEIIIKSVRLEEVKSALQEIGIDEIMESKLTCHGHQKRYTTLYRAAKYVANSIQKIKLEIIAADDAVETILKAIDNITRTEPKEDCRVYILPLA
ncbi:MAG: P-II family nitrogen regulator [Deltaproteobacteria bacterium]|nr:P-II family nitrogen regulator [Deltaproteobacteria bacterium]